MKHLKFEKAFLRRVAFVALPILIQNFITNFVSLLDNIMVGQIATEQMSGVAIVNTLLFVFNLAIFGAVSGPGIFTAQFVGKGDLDGVRQTFRIKLIFVVVLVIVGIAVLTLFQDRLILLYLHKSSENIDIAATLSYAKTYLEIMLVGMVPFALANAYSGTLRESGETIVPMAAGITAVVINLALNYILIFGHFGAPKMGVAGAALATVISRFAELAIIVFYTHTHTKKLPFIKGAFKGFHISGSLFKQVLIKGTPLFANEFLWSLGMSAVTQCYSTRGVEVVAAFNISNTIVNLFNVAFISMGSVVAIIIGQELGSGHLDTVVDTDRKLIFISVVMSMVLGAVLFAMAPLFPKLYNTSPEIRLLATRLMMIAACFMPVSSYLNAAYFTLRSGGKTLITFFFDSFFLIVCSWPVAFMLSRFTDIPILTMYTVILALDFIKVLIGHILIKKKIWIVDMVK
ncbi:MAG: MATE family efflux transporter [Lachnospiraceae bacterium]|nr:MATE family efflux transporter [Lachnospiraceae bacterium]